MIKVDQLFNDSVRIFNLPFEMKRYSWFDFEDIKNSEPLFLKSIFKIRGVERIKTDRYSVGVRKADAFEWYKIEPQILEILEKEILNQKAIDDAIDFGMRVMP
jgi:hypothetical protein